MKYAVITGVSTGIGHEAARYFLSRGWYVFGSVRRRQDAHSLVDAFANTFQALVMDVTDHEQVARAVEDVTDTLGGSTLNVLINNAGVAYSGPVAHLPLEVYRQQFEVNVFGQIRVTQAFLPLLGMRRGMTNRGRIINISSVSGTFSSPFLSPYGSSKYALEAISDALRRELLIYRIPVSVVRPASVHSAIWGKARKGETYTEGTDFAFIADAQSKLLDRSEKRAISTERAARLIFRIANMRKPRPHYLLTRNNLLYKMIFALPDRWVDAAVRRQLKPYRVD